MRILQIAHNHPAFHAGGTEAVAMALHRNALEQGHDSFFLGATDSTQRKPNPGTNLLAMSPDGRENVIWFPSFERFDLQQVDTFGGLWEFRAFLQTIRPEIIHIHHFLNFGIEMFFVVRNALPETKIVLTLHDYYTICPSNGQLFKYHTMSRCNGPSVIDCQKCFPQRDLIAFQLRALAVKRAISLCDTVTAPSHFLRRMVEPHLGVSRPIEVIENGYMGDVDHLPAQENVPAEPIKFSYFGNISEVKGLQDLLRAVQLLVEEGVSGFHLDVHGRQLFDDKILEKAIKKARRKHSEYVTFHGAYQQHETQALMSAADVVVFPSIWWENAPLVVYEALYAKRPVLCYPHSAAVEILHKNGKAVIATDSNPRALAASMKGIVADPRTARVTNEVDVRCARDVFNDYLAVYRRAA